MDVIPLYQIMDLVKYIFGWVVVVVYLTSYIIYIAELTLYELFLLCIPKSISNVHAVSLITSASVARQYFCTPASSDMWKLQSLK